MLILKNTRIAKISTLADGTFRITLDLQEVSSEEILEIMNIYKKREADIMMGNDKESELIISLVNHINNLNEEQLNDFIKNATE